MPIKVSQLTELSVIDGTVVVPVIDNGAITPISKKATIENVANFILQGNAATATVLETPRNINGVAFDGSADITVTVPLSAATTSVIGGVIVGSGISVEADGTISVDIIPVATTSIAGTVIIGAGISVAVDGTISTPTRKFHGFGVDSNSNLIYYTTEDATINLQDSTGADIYEDVDIGTNEYAYSLDANGNLIVTYS
jgi:hypothetical protein